MNPDAFRYLDIPERPRDHSDDVPAESLKPPKFVVPLVNARFDEGSHPQIACKLEGYPFPTVLWFKDNRPLPASNRLLTNYNLNSGVVSLKINDVQTGDAGHYIAYAENKVGSDQTECQVGVNELPAIDRTPMVKPDAFKYLEGPKESKRPNNDKAHYMPPKFVVPLSDKNIEEGQTVPLACKVEGYPKPKISWFKDGKPLQASNRFTPEYDLYSGIVNLKIADSQVNDAGNYVAVAENEVGQDQTSCNATVKQMPNIDRTPMVNPEAFKYLENQPMDRSNRDPNEKLFPPKVIIPLEDVKLEEGQGVLLACKIEGYPRPKVNLIFKIYKGKCQVLSKQIT